MAGYRSKARLASPDRSRRIAELLCKAVQVAKAEPVEAPRHILNLASESPVRSDDERVLNYLHNVEQASPRVIRAALGLSKTTAYRVLLRLGQEGAIGTGGNSRAVVHWLIKRDAGSSEFPADRRASRPRLAASERARARVGMVPPHDE